MTSQQIRDAALKGHTCCGEVWSGMGWFKCSCAAKVMRDGKPYCLRHDPVKVAEKKADRDAKRKAEWAEADALREKAARLRACERAVLEAAERYEVATLAYIADPDGPKENPGQIEAAFISAGEHVCETVAAWREAKRGA